MDARDVAEQFNIETVVRVEPYGSGRINKTYLVETASDSKTILQTMHRIFAPTLMHDFDAVTRHLDERGVKTPRAVPRKDGMIAGVETDDAWWRMQTFIPGTTFIKNISSEQAESAGALLGTFHAALADCTHSFRHRLDGFHDTPRIMKRLSETLWTMRGGAKEKTLAPIGKRILDWYGNIKADRGTLPKRVTHGDLKISNIRFDGSGVRAVALIDLDTISRGSIAADVGEAVASWSNRAGEDNTSACRFDLDVYAPLIRGYRGAAAFLTKEELSAIPAEIENAILELAARFVIDAFEESYFMLDSSRYRTLYNQNLTRAQSQVSLYEDVLSKRPAIAKLTQ